jgi:hypothetical protein
LLRSQRSGRLSAKAHATGQSDGIAETDWLRDRTAGWVCTWRDFLLERDETDLATRLRHGETTGRPIGDRPFVKTIGRILGRDLLPKKPGRKPKTQTNGTQPKSDK